MESRDVLRLYSALPPPTIMEPCNHNEISVTMQCESSKT